LPKAVQGGAGKLFWALTERGRGLAELEKSFDKNLFASPFNKYLFNYTLSARYIWINSTFKITFYVNFQLSTIYFNAGLSGIWSLVQSSNGMKKSRTNLGGPDKGDLIRHRNAPVQD
jgi:hypothetical protein